MFTQICTVVLDLIDSDKVFDEFGGINYHIYYISVLFAHILSQCFLWKKYSWCHCLVPLLSTASSLKKQNPKHVCLNTLTSLCGSQPQANITETGGKLCICWGLFAAVNKSTFSAIMAAVVHVLLFGLGNLINTEPYGCTRVTGHHKSFLVERKGTGLT